MTILVGILGGLAIFLYGMQLCSDGLQKAAAGKLKAILYKLTANRFLGVIVGAVVTILLQSSSATTVMLVGLTNAALMSLKQTLGVILGADIGTTFTVQLIAFKLSDYALLMVALGILLMFTAKKQKGRFISQVILGFGFVFFGMKVMSDSVLPLKESPMFGEMMVRFGEQPLLALLASTIFTGIIQGSAATIGLVLSLSTQGLLPLDTAIYIILGANIGTTATAMLSSIGATREGKMVAYVHTGFKILGVIVFLPFMGPFIHLVEATATDITRQIANAHTLFNVGITIIFLPFVQWIAMVVERLVPERADEENLSRPRYLDRKALGSPAIALDQAEHEVQRVAEIVKDMVGHVGKLIGEWQEGLVKETMQREEAVDQLCVEISQYLSDVSQNTMSEEDSQRIVRLLHVVNDLEHIGDCMVGLGHIAQKKITSGLNFSDPGQQEMVGYYNKVADLYANAMQALVTADANLATQVLEAQVDAVAEERALRERHIARLQAGLSLSRETSSIHLDALIGLRRIADHSAGIAHTVRDGHPGSLPGQSEWTAETKAINSDLPRQAEG